MYIGPKTTSFFSDLVDPIKGMSVLKRSALLEIAMNNFLACMYLQRQLYHIERTFKTRSCTAESHKTPAE